MNKKATDGLFWSAFIIGIYLFINIYKHTLIDDSYIYLGYVRNLWSNYTWGMLKGNIANTATSPLNVMLLSIVALITGANENAAIVMATILLWVTAYLLCRVSEQLFHTRLYGMVAAIYVIFNPLLLSTIGMESILLTCLFVLSLKAYHNKNILKLGIALGLITITRGDGCLFYVIFLLFLDSKKERLQLTKYYLLCATPWYFVSWIYLGSFVPDTMFIKMAIGSWGKWTYANGIIMYLIKYPVETIFTFSSLILVPFTLFKNIYKKTILKILIICIIIHYIAYTFLHVPPHHWYYTFEVLFIILIGTFGLGYLMTLEDKKQCISIVSKKTRYALTCLLISIPIMGISYLLYQVKWVPGEAHIHSNGATRDQYKAVANDISNITESEASIRLHNVEIGALSHFSERYLRGLISDRKLLIEIFEKHASSAPYNSSLLKKLLLFNNYFLHVQTHFPTTRYVLTDEIMPQKATKLIKEWQLTSNWTDQNIMLYEINQEHSER